MTVLQIPLAPELEAKLRAKADAVGQDVTAYAAGVLARSAEPPLPLQQISGPIGQAFEESGLTEDELGDLLEEIKHDHRRRDGHQQN